MRVTRPIYVTGAVALCLLADGRIVATAGGGASGPPATRAVLLPRENPIAKNTAQSAGVPALIILNSKLYAGWYEASGPVGEFLMRLSGLVPAARKSRLAKFLVAAIGLAIASRSDAAALSPAPPESTTKMRPVVGLTATPHAPFPTSTVATTWLVAALRTQTRPWRLSVT